MKDIGFKGERLVEMIEGEVARFDAVIAEKNFFENRFGTSGKRRKLRGGQQSIPTLGLGESIWRRRAPRADHEHGERITQGARSRHRASSPLDGPEEPRHNGRMQLFIAGVIGLVSGIMSGLFGVGGGIVMVPAMMFFMKLDIKLAVGTSLAVIIPTALVGSAKHFQMGNVDWKVALSLAPMALVGSYGGAWLTQKIASADLKRAFGGFLILVGFRLVFLK